jgi:hypothetical protein
MNRKHMYMHKNLLGKCLVFLYVQSNGIKDM